MKEGRRWHFPVGVAVVGAYFCYFVLPSLHGWFNDDDPMNIHYFWVGGLWELVRGLLLFFTPSYRPMGGIYFYTLYEFFGLNPFPYHVVIVILLLTNVFLAYRCATRLSGSQVVGGFSAVLMAYHAKLSGLAYLPAFVYDVLCFTFYFSALASPKGGQPPIDPKSDLPENQTPAISSLGRGTTGCGRQTMSSSLT